MSQNAAHEPSDKSVCEDLRELLPAYLIGASDPDEVALVETLLEQCPEVQSEFADYWNITETFYADVAPRTPPQSVHDKLLARVKADKAQPEAISSAVPVSSISAEEKLAESITDTGVVEKPSEAVNTPIISVAETQKVTPETPTITSLPQRSGQLDRQPLQLDATLIKPINRKIDYTRWTGWAALAAAVLALFFSNVFWADRLNLVEEEINDLNREREQAVNLAGRADLQRVSLSGTTNTEQQFATLLWDAEAETITLTTTELPDLPANQTYQLWLIEEGQPVDAGIFQADEWGVVTYTAHLNQPIGNYQAVAISREPASGSTAPTTDPIAVGEFAFGDL
jgi:hypothetical protein